MVYCEKAFYYENGQKNLRPITELTGTCDDPPRLFRRSPVICKNEMHLAGRHHNGSTRRARRPKAVNGNVCETNTMQYRDCHREVITAPLPRTEMRSSSTRSSGSSEHHALGSGSLSVIMKCSSSSWETDHAKYRQTVCFWYSQLHLSHYCTNSRYTSLECAA